MKSIPFYQGHPHPRHLQDCGTWLGPLPLHVPICGGGGEGITTPPSWGCQEVKMNHLFLAWKRVENISLFLTCPFQSHGKAPSKEGLNAAQRKCSAHFIRRNSGNPGFEGGTPCVGWTPSCQQVLFDPGEGKDTSPADPSIVLRPRGWEGVCRPDLGRGCAVSPHSSPGRPTQAAGWLTSLSTFTQILPAKF